MNKQGFSLLTVKAFDEEARTFSGIASTPALDRQNDSVDPMGSVFKTPLPLLLYHDSTLPVGTVNLAKATKAGIPFTASIPAITEPGTLQDRVNEAWQSIKYKLIAAVSIGFRVLDDGIEAFDNGGFLVKKWEWLELSLVAIPAQPEAVITSFKSMDAAKIRAAIGIKRTAAPGIVRLRQLPGASGQKGVVRLRTPIPTEEPQ